MPFKSEKQRKYLWANEPKIAREWTDTYGSRIHKNDGGIAETPEGQTRGSVQARLDGRRPGYTEDDEDTGGAGHHGGGHGNQGSDKGHSRFKVGSGYYGEKKSTPKEKPDRDGPLDRFRQKSINSFVHRNKKKNLNKALDYGLIDKLKGRGVNEDEVGSYDIDSIREIASRFGGDLTKSQTSGLAGFRKDLGFEEKFKDTKPTQTQFEDYYGLNKPLDTGGGGDGGQVPWWLRQQAPAASTPDATTTASTLGGGHFQVPIDYVQNQTRAAEGGRIGYQMGNMVEGEMEGAEMEGAVMQSKEVIKELYDALIAQGLSPQKTMEKIKEMIASSQTQEPQSPMMGEELPGQEFGRAPAAFGGIMDTYTGRRKYGLGSFFSKAAKKVKKLASSKIGKIALMYAAGTYLGGTEAFGGTGQLSFADRLRDPKLLANLINPTGGGIGEGKGWSMFSSPATKKVGEEVGKKAAGDWSKWILPASVGIGALSAKMPVEELDDVQGEWDADKAKFDAYLASLDTGDSYRVPEEYRKAQGGRIGADEGGLMNLGGMEKDYRNDGGFVPLGGEEKADDVPARLSKNEFVFTADAVRSAGGGDIDKGAQVMENVMKNLEGGGQISEESQGQGAQEMFETSERLSEVI